MPATKLKSLECVCPHCLDESNAVRLDLNDLNEVTCDCGETFSPRAAAERFAAMAEKWSKVAEWVDAAPAV